MTAKELIKSLKNYPENTEVRFSVAKGKGMTLHSVNATENYHGIVLLKSAWL